MGNKHTPTPWLLIDHRKDDCSYFAARLIGRLHDAKDKESCSLGIWNTSESDAKTILTGDWKDLKEFSHGDEGIMLIDVLNFKVDVLNYDYFK